MEYKRKRGRPKNPVADPFDVQTTAPAFFPMDDAEHAEAAAPGLGMESKRKRGRPKNPVADPFDVQTAAPASSPMDNAEHAEASAPGPRQSRGRPHKPVAKQEHGLPPPVAGQAEGRGDGSHPKATRHQGAADVKAGDPVADTKGGPSSPLRSRLVGERGDHGVVAEQPRVMPSMDAVVKVFCVHTEPNFSLPWQRKRQCSSSSSGFIVGGRRVLTNAHSVEHYTQVKLKKRGSDTKYLATVLAIGTECDVGCEDGDPNRQLREAHDVLSCIPIELKQRLHFNYSSFALLTVNDDEFWDGVSPVEFGPLPALQDAVTVVGYPIGGDTISVTSGVVSRLEILSYVHGSTELLGLQIDAAINSGNSGGPAFNDKGNCVGIAFQSLKHEDVENIGYVIPTPVILHFIRDYEKSGGYTGFPILGIEWQKMENPDLRKAMGMSPDQKGVRVRRVEPTALESQFLKPSDIILSFDRIDIANDGTVPFRHGERIGFSYLVSQKYTGETAVVKILRKSKVHEFNIRLATHRRLVPAHIKGKPPSYYIIAGFVFTSISVPYLRSEYGKDYEYDTPVKLLDKLLHSMAQSEDEQLVVVSQVLVADINIGYEDIVNTQVLSFNGKPVKNLKGLATMVKNCEDEFLRFDLEYDQIVVLKTKTAKAATHEILTTHCIPSAMSDDLRA